jgi:hypothetical protein
MVAALRQLRRKVDYKVKMSYSHNHYSIVGLSLLDQVVE